MTTYTTEDRTCAVCGLESEHDVVASTNAQGTSDLDLRPAETQRSTMAAWIQRCPHCGFCAPDIGEDEDDVDVESDAYCTQLADERYPELARRFLCFAIITDDSDPRTAALSRLHAAWACDDAGLAECALACRNGAAAAFERVRPFDDDEVGVSEGAIFVDVLRRAGRFDEAVLALGDLLGLEAAAGLVRRVLEFQAELIEREDTAAHCVAECGEPA